MKGTTHSKLIDEDGKGLERNSEQIQLSNQTGHESDPRMLEATETPM